MSIKFEELPFWKKDLVNMVFFSVHFLRVQTWVETCLAGIQEQNIRKCWHTSDLFVKYLCSFPWTLFQKRENCLSVLP